MVSLINAGQPDVLCPPTDVYVLRLTDATDPELVPAYGEDRTDPNCKKEWQTTFTYKIAECDLEPDDDEAAALAEQGLSDWNGFPIRQFYRIGKDLNHPKSGLGAALKALMKVNEIPVGTQIEMTEYFGTRIKATVAPNKNGWPRVTSPVAYRQRKPKPAVVQPVEVDDDDDLFGDAS